MTTEAVKTENNYQAAFRALKERKPTVAWVELVRDSAMDRFESLGFPAVTNEEWKYTNLGPLAKQDFSAASPRAVPDNAGQFSFPETHESHIVLVNGILHPELSRTKNLEGVVAIDLFSAIADARYSKVVRNYLARNANYHDRGLTALNTAFLESGLFVLVPKNFQMESPLQITCIADSIDTGVANFPRVLFVAEENSSAKLVERFVSVGQQSTFTNSVVEVVLMDGARLKHDRLQQEGSAAFHVATTSAELGRGSSYNSTAINLGAKLARHDISVVMNHEGAECWVDGLYVVGSNQHSDTHSVIDHKQPYCNSHQLYKGILDGNGRAVFNGKIFVREGAQKTDAMQTNKNLLLSPAARVDTKPQLEIYADDVKCAHGAAVGQLDQEELFYLETRGIGPELGKSLLTYGFAEEVIGKIGIESIRTQLDQAVLSQIHAPLKTEVQL
ncbi:MAG TPA: Fe-S cluster assembly protein SufD [Pyrinomonadaceae bacterium]|nr:Fe-S cluster assembly protein SufD [Pyrinomonadaceae bacterium]